MQRYYGSGRGEQNTQRHGQLDARYDLGYAARAEGVGSEVKERAATDGIEAKARRRLRGGADTVEVGIEKAGPGLEAAATQELAGTEERALK